MDIRYTVKRENIIGTEDLIMCTIVAHLKTCENGEKANWWKLKFGIHQRAA